MRAETVLDNLGDPVFNTAVGGDLVGAAIQIGSTPITISTVEFHQFFTGGYVFRPGQTFAIYSRNANGTLGTPLFTDFTLTPNSQAVLTTATANSAYVLQANTAYWLVLVAPPGTFVLWNYTPVTTYTSALGVTIPAQLASFYRDAGEDNYFSLSQGPQELRVTASAATIPPPTPQRVVSRKLHGTAAYDIELPPTGPAGIECRSGGSAMEYQLVLSFPSTVSFQSAQVTTGTGQVVSAQVNGTGAEGTPSQITINLNGVTDGQNLAVTVFGLSDGNSTGDFVAGLGVLLGDTTGNGSVNSADIAFAKVKSGEALNGSNFRADVTVNGSINGSDNALVKSRAGASLPAARQGVGATR